MIQKQLNGAMVKGEGAKGVSVDVTAMKVDMDSERQEAAALLPNFTFADFTHLADMRTSKSGAPIMPNYNKETASDNLNRFVELMNKAPEYMEAGILSSSVPEFQMKGVTFTGGQRNEFAPATVAEFQMKGVDTITGSTNGFLNIAPDFGSVATGFSSEAVLTNDIIGTASPYPYLNNPYPYENNLNQGNLVNSTDSNSSQFDYMSGTTFKTFDSFVTLK